MRRPLNVQLTDEALEIVMANTSERKRGDWISRLVIAASRLPDASGAELCEVLGEIVGLVIGK